jgi:two-component system, chemotaxis family, chemotaxis protein CheY
MKKKVLLVDDKVEFRRLVKIFLSSKYEVETAENGLKAFALLQKGFLPDIIVSDLMMPVVDGRSLVSQLKASGVFSHIPIIILSSIDKSADKIELFKLGASDYLVKPFNPEELEIRIANLLKVVA